MQKQFITPNRKWWSFCAVSDNGQVGQTPYFNGSGYYQRTSAIINMYSIFDKIGEGVICTIKIERPSGALTLSFDQRSLRFLKQYHIDPEQWLNEAYNYILRCDEFIAIDEYGKIDPLNNEKDFMLIDAKGRIPTDDLIPDPKPTEVDVLTSLNRAHTFIQSITDPDGPYTDINRTRVVADAWGEASALREVIEQLEGVK